jgi:choline-sulfatase
MKRPLNLILITADELRADCVGFMGHPLRPTPQLDRLAARGVVMEHHFTVHGKCVPSRAAMLTGRYTHTDGHRAINHVCTIPDGAPNLHLELKRRGYETAFFGHNHTHENLLNGKNKKGENIADYHSYTDDYFVALNERTWPVPPPSTVPPTAPHPCLATDCVTDPITGFVDDNKAEQAIHYLKSVRDRARPFYLHLNLGLPHPPYRVEEPYYSMHDRARIEPYPIGLPERAPLPLRAMHEIRGGAQMTDAAARELLAVYLGMVSKVDALIGRVLGAVEEENLWSDTIVLFTSDHGDFASQYGLPEMWDTAMQDCILRVPLILCAPTLSPGRIQSGLSEHVDIPPTILDLMGIAPGPEWGIHGQSLLPAISGGEGKSLVFADGGHEPDAIRRFDATCTHSLPDGTIELTTLGKQKTYHDYPDSMARTKMVRSRDWKLVIRLAGGHELYHVAEDPFEMRNLYGQPGTAAMTAALMQELVLWSLRTDTDRPFLEHVGA